MHEPDLARVVFQVDRNRLTSEHDAEYPTTIDSASRACEGDDRLIADDVDGGQTTEHRQGDIKRIGEAAAAGANIVCLQELFAGHYPCQSEDHARFAEAESIPGPTSEALAAAAKQYGVVIVSSLFERRAGRTVPQYLAGVRR